MADRNSCASLFAKQQKSVDFWCARNARFCAHSSGRNTTAQRIFSAAIRLVFFLLFSFVLLSGVSTTIRSEADESQFTYTEGEVVRIVTEASDEDNDIIVFNYSSPLNSSGEWQTGYDDAGEYTIIVTAFDGEQRTEQEVTLVITNVNRPPELNMGDIEISETEHAILLFNASDPDGDTLTFAASAPFNASAEWTPGFEDAGQYEIEVTASDGSLEATKIINVNVYDKNRAPSFLLTEPSDDELELQETEQLELIAEAEDYDGEEVRYTWYVDDVEVAQGGSFVYAPDYASAGGHEIRVDANDGQDTSARSWKVNVGNVNRPPSLAELQDITAHENETVRIELPAVDIDGEPIAYNLSEPFGADGVWATTFSDSGTYTITITASDGELEDTQTISVTVLDVDRPPVFEMVQPTHIREDERLRLQLSATDPDGEDVSFSSDSLPDGAVLDDSDLKWYPGYDFVLMPKTWVAQVFKRAGIARRVYSQELKLHPIITACGRVACTNQTIELAVSDVNRAPALDDIAEVTVNESGIISIAPSASDPDGDHVRFYYTSPLNRRGVWVTNYTDAGEYIALVGATDGNLSTEKQVRVTVTNVNRNPTFGQLSDYNVRENQTLSFAVPVMDPDGEDVTLWAEDLPAGAEFIDGMFNWTPDFDVVGHNDSGKMEYTLTFAATSELGDEPLTVKKQVKIVVKDLNRRPVVTAFAPAQSSSALVRQPLEFRATAADPDGDKVTYRWKFGLFDSISAPAVRRTFVSPGVKEVELVVTDGDDKEGYVWSVDVRKPAIKVEPASPVVVEQPPQQQPIKFVTAELEG